MNFTDLKLMRAAAASGELVAIAREALLGIVGPRAEEAIDAPGGRAALVRYTDMALALTEAVAAFDGTPEAAESLSVAAIAYRDGHRVLMAQIERITSSALGLPLQ